MRSPALPSLPTARIGPVVALCLLAGLASALFLVLVPFGGATEGRVTSVALLAFASGWALLAVLSIRLTNQPQRWAFTPAAVMAIAGLGLLLRPDSVEREWFAWGWPVGLLALVLRMATQARAQLHGRARTWLIQPLFVALVLAALAGLMESALESRDRGALPRKGELIDVGGRRLDLQVSGEGGPTVVLVPGAGETTATWGWIEPEIARHTRVCVYDRAGRGWSEDAPGPQDGHALAADLHALLHRAEVPGPFVLVGHSLGGLVSLVYSEQYPEDVAGVVLLDSTHPDMFTRVAIYPGLWETYRRVSALFPSLARLGVGRLVYRADFDNLPPAARDAECAFWSTARHARSAHDEWAEIPQLMEQARALRTLGARPLIVVTAGLQAQEGWLPLQDDLARLSTRSGHRVLPAISHMALVQTRGGAAEASRAILDVVEAVRTSGAVRVP